MYYPPAFFYSSSIFIFNFHPVIWGLVAVATDWAGNSRCHSPQQHIPINLEGSWEVPMPDILSFQWILGLPWALDQLTMPGKLPDVQTTSTGPFRKDGAAALLLTLYPILSPATVQRNLMPVANMQPKFMIIGWLACRSTSILLLQLYDRTLLLLPPQQDILSISSIPLSFVNSTNLGSSIL